MGWGPESEPDCSLLIGKTSISASQHSQRKLAMKITCCYLPLATRFSPSSSVASLSDGQPRASHTSRMATRCSSTRAPLMSRFKNHPKMAAPIDAFAIPSMENSDEDSFLSLKRNPTTRVRKMIEAATLKRKTTVPRNQPFDVTEYVKTLTATSVRARAFYVTM